jgi:hypothetical protein
MANPTIKQLQNKEHFELIDELEHKQIKEFVINQLSAGGWLVKSFMIYQIMMLVLASFIITRAVIFTFQNNPEPLFYIISGLLFCVSILIVFHELLHGLALKLTGAKKVNYGGYFRKFIFYAEADQHVLNKKQFAFIALAPFVVIKIFTVLGSILFFHHPFSYFLVFIMCAHSLFCAGDIGLLTIFYNNGKAEIFTYDVKNEKKSYYFKRLK